MPQKLPQVSGKDVIRLLKDLGYSVIRQKGSHVRLAKETKMGAHRITVLDHKTIAKGTLNDILSKVGLWNSISKEQLIDKLR